jgi:hypothetical protein
MREGNSEINFALCEHVAGEIENHFGWIIGEGI